MKNSILLVILGITLGVGGAYALKHDRTPYQDDTPQTDYVSHGEADHGVEAGHNHSDHDHGALVVEAGSIPQVILSARNITHSSVDLLLDTENFTFTPEQVNGEHVAGTGHAHVYVDDKKIGRIYSQWHHLSGLTPGEHTIKVTLNTNDHRDYSDESGPIGDSITITIPESVE